MRGDTTMTLRAEIPRTCARCGGWNYGDRDRNGLYFRCLTCGAETQLSNDGRLLVPLERPVETRGGFRPHPKLRGGSPL